jgi:hypothetical protein
MGGFNVAIKVDQMPLEDLHKLIFTTLNSAGIALVYEKSLFESGEYVAIRKVAETAYKKSLRIT